MRKAQQQDILNVIETMGEAHEEIRQALEKKELAPAKQMLIECQECAIDLGNAIEQIEGEGFVSVSYLEKYCDTVYRLFEETDTDSNPAKVAKTLRKVLLQVENSVKNDVKIRKEVVFFPYKASMWDSLESVYLAAKEDEDCDAYCVPIPYYDRRPDGSFSEFHYEGNLYPKNIEITDFRTYNLEERHPDVIYIHNPYDEWNHVTSVPERYYAKNLCYHTDKLVYIPYFMLGETNAKDQSDVDGMKHFCFLPGTIYADKVIVQSENMRQIYITEYIKAAKECGLTGEHVDRRFQEQKILGLGSPKVDKVLNTRKEGLEIPEEWLKIIEKLDGTWKKIVFYNTTINGLLHNDERMLKKIERVFAVFKENRDEVALLWRPHPLIENTLTSMRPQLWEEYQKIRDRYIEEGWGIYDDTADMDRAVALSDAYYGDQSSVLQVYKKTGKPIMLQQCDYTESPVAIARAKAIVYAEGYYWYVPVYGDTLYRMNPETMEIEYVCSMTSGKEGYWLYSDIVCIGHKLYFVPLHAVDIAIYDMERKELYKLSFREDYTGGIPDATFSGYEIYGKKLYLFPSHYSAIVCINEDTEAVEQYTLPIEEEIKIYGKGCLCHGSVFIPDYGSNSVLKFNIEDKIFTKIMVEEGFHCEKVYEAENGVYLMPLKATEGIYLWNVIDEKIERRILFPTKIIEDSEQEKYVQVNGEEVFLSGSDLGYDIRVGDKIYMAGSSVKQGAILDVQTGEIEPWELPTDMLEPDEYIPFNYKNRTLGMAVVDGNLTVVNGINGEWIRVYDRNECRIMREDVGYADEAKRKILENAKSMKEEMIGLVQYINQFIGYRDYQKDVEMTENVGNKIQRVVCEE